MSNLYIETRLKAIKDIASASCVDEKDADNIADFCDEIYSAIEIVKQKSEKFVTDTNVGSNGNGVIKFANLLKELCCKKDEDYDNPVIFPKYLNDIIENLLLDYTEQYTNGWQVGVSDDVCKWKLDDDNLITSCDDYFNLYDNCTEKFKYCPRCGKKDKEGGLNGRYYQ